jgi:RNA polymerase sigma-B factor
MLEEATRREQRGLTLLRRYREHGDVFARDELARSCRPLVRSIVRKYVGRGESHEDLHQAGMLGLTKAIERYDLETGNRFVSFAVPNITGEIRRHFRDCTWAVHVPRSVQELDARVQATVAAEAAAGRPDPTDEQLARLLGEPVERIRDAVVAGRNYRSLSYDAPSGEGRDGLDVLGVGEAGYREVEDRAVLDDAMAVLPERDRRIVDWRYRDGLLQREIAERVGVSQMQVSRLLSQSIARMGEHVEQGPAAA